MAVNDFDTFSMSVSTTELSCTNQSSTIATNTTAGFFCLIVDCNAVAAGDEFEVRLLEKARSSDTQREVFKASITTSTGPIWISPMFPLVDGWDFTLKKISGTDRTLTGSIRQA